MMAETEFAFRRQEMTATLQRAEPKREKMERVDEVVERGLDIVTTLLVIGTALPVVLGGICGVTKDILEDVRKYKGRAEDVAQAGSRVVDVLEFLQLLAHRVRVRNLPAIDKVRRAMEDLKLLLDDFKTAVQAFGNRGFLKRAWKLRKHAGTLSLLDEKIRCWKLDMLWKVYGLARDDHVEELLLRTVPYKLEEALRKHVERHDNDESALGDVAKEGGVDPEETRTGLESLHRVGEDINSQLKEMKEIMAQLKRAIERSDLPAVQLAGEKASDLMARTGSLSVYERGLVSKLLAACFSGDANKIESLLEKENDIIHEMSSDVGGGAAWALSALHVSAMLGNIGVIKRLHSKNGDFTRPDARKRTPLHHAAAHGHVKVISYLLTHCGVDVNAMAGSAPGQP
ncbi:hypothetical protein CTAYLR_002598 [Chrysophaeum taylorii]|uniref:Uncharacterized protein n=1 Tax=Chrysophaeum taylorii TaxID=2483200 RepID=A0AAD7XIG7_9STRA|nr:hypothetical protein CTAYLR_002598 [Chrysophaeum taylorii]